MTKQKESCPVCGAIRGVYIIKENDKGIVYACNKGKCKTTWTYRKPKESK